MTLLNYRPLLIAGAMAISALTSACGTLSGDVGLSVVGVNYTESEYSMIVRDPHNKNNSGVTGELTPYSAGGQMCCFSLPSKWRSDLTVEVTSLRALIEDDKVIGKDVTTTVVPIPKYDPDQMGTFWVLQFDDRVEVLNSMYAPEHPQWEGPVKGWPVPSLNYRKKIWDIYYRQAVEALDFYKRVVQLGATDPASRAQTVWRIDGLDRPEDLKGFSGPNDPAFIQKALDDDKENLKRTLLKVDELKRREPK